MTEVWRLVGPTLCLTVSSSLLLNVALSVCCFLFVWLTTYAFPCQSVAKSVLLIFSLISSYKLICSSLPLLLPVLPSAISVVLPLIQCLYDSAVNFSFFHSSHPLFISFSSSSLSPRVTLDPSKRQSSNKSMSGCTLPQGTKTVSKSSFPMFSGCFCLPDCLPASQCPAVHLSLHSHCLSLVRF